MAKFYVRVREVHTTLYEVIDIDTPQEAIEAVQVRGSNATFIDDSLEYSHELPTDTWTVEDENGKQVIG